MKYLLIFQLFITNTISECLNENGDILTFGGFNSTKKSIASVNLVNLTTKESCLRSELPVPLKEAHVFEFDGTLLLCTSFTKTNKNQLQCFKWSENLDGAWLNFPTPMGNRMKKFISAVKVPNVGIWFMGSKNGNTLILNENGDWSVGAKWTNTRTRACSVLISSTKVAHIGGQKAKGATELIGNTIDVMDLADITESTTVAKMNSFRKHLSCALIPKGQNDNPTVAILGDNSAPYTFQMELWDTVTNDITTVSHPPGFENLRLFRPVMATLDENSILLAGSKVFDDNGSSFMPEMFQYKIGTGWINLGEIEPALEAKEQFGIYVLDKSGTSTP